MEEHAGRRHKGPEAAAQTGRGESKGNAFSSLSLRVSNCQMEGKRKNKSQSTEAVCTSQLSGSQSMLRTVEMDQVGRYPEESVYIHNQVEFLEMSNNIFIKLKGIYLYHHI